MVEIDGSLGEGGGQIIRTCLTLSAITGKGFKLSHVRSKRDKPGLRPQHLMACLAVHRICDGKLEGANLGSDYLLFEPNKIVGGEYEFNIGTAGSITLLAQTIIPICLYAVKPSIITLIGGTHVRKSPSYDYFDEVFISAIKQFGAAVNPTLVKVGYYPKGNGKIGLNISPVQLIGCIDWPICEKKSAIIRLSHLPRHIADREHNILLQAGIEDIEIYEDDSLSPGNAVTLYQGFKGACAMGEIGKRAEQVANEAISQLQQDEFDVDSHLADQLLIYACLARGRSSYTTSRISEHLRTNIYIVQKFLDKNIVIKGNKILIS